MASPSALISHNLFLQLFVFDFSSMKNFECNGLRDERRKMWKLKETNEIFENTVTKTSVG